MHYPFPRILIILHFDIGQPNLQEVIVANLRDALPAMLKPIHDDIQQLRGDVKQIQEELRHTRRLTARVSYEPFTCEGFVHLIVTI